MVNNLEIKKMENISSKSTYEIVVLKGVFSGLGALVIALLKRESMPGIWYIGATLILGFVAYGLRFSFMFGHKMLSERQRPAHTMQSRHLSEHFWLLQFSENSYHRCILLR